MGYIYIYSQLQLGDVRKTELGDFVGWFWDHKFESQAPPALTHPGGLSYHPG